MLWYNVLEDILRNTTCHDLLWYNVLENISRDTRGKCQLRTWMGDTEV